MTCIRGYNRLRLEDCLSACRRRAEQNTDSLTMLNMAHPSNHETNEMGTKTNDCVTNSLSKDAFVNDAMKSD